MLHDLSYMAALIDGEGCVGYHSCGRGKSPRFIMEIRMTDEAVIDWVTDTFGGIKSYYPTKNPKHKDQWRWRVQRSFAMKLYSELKPLLKIKGRF